MNLEGVMLSEINPKSEDTYWIVLLMKNTENSSIHRSKVNNAGQGLGGERLGVAIESIQTKLQLTKKFWR